MGIPTLISTATITSDTAAVDITSGIDGTYDEYMFVYTDFEPITDGAHFGFQCSIDAGSNYNVVHINSLWAGMHSEGGTSAFAINTGYDDALSDSIISLNVGTGTTTDESAAGILHLFSPASTTYVKHWTARTQSYQDNDYSTDIFSAGYFNDANDINAIKFYPSSGNIANVVIQMYGIA